MKSIKNSAADNSSSFSLFGQPIPSWGMLIIILVLAACLRFYQLGTNPPSPYWEEVALGYDAYSIAKTGKDFHGNPYPLLSFPSFGDYKPSGYFYVLAPFVKILGLSALSVRLPSAIAGVISVGVLYLITKEYFDSRVAVIAAALLAASPWALQFSRGGWEVNVALMFVLIGTWVVLMARARPWVLPIAVLFFGASMYTYHAARLFAPVWGAAAGILLIRFWWEHRMIGRERWLSVGLSLLLAIAVVLPLVVNLKSDSVSSRFDATSIFSDLRPIIRSNEQIELHGNTPLARIIYHRYWFYGQMIANGFLSHFSPQFLFGRGDGNLRHGTVAFGLLYPMDAAFILMAAYYAVRKKERKILVVMIPLLIAGIAPSLVTPTPHALRFLFALPAFVLIAAYGVSEFTLKCQFNQLSARRTGIALMYAYFISAYLTYYYMKYPIKAAADWQYGYEQLYEVIAQEKLDSEQVYISREQGRPSMYYLFYSSYDPELLQRKEPALPKDQLELLQVDEYHFVDGIPQNKGVFATSKEKVDPKANILDTITRPDGSVVWVVWRR